MLSLCGFMFKMFIAMLLVLGLVFSSSGTTTLQWPNSAYFNFYPGETISYDEYLASNPTEDPSAIYDIALEPWDKPGWCANHIDMGAVNLDSLEYPPSSGYSDDELGFADCSYIEQGHAYWVKTRDGKYAKIKVIEATHLGVDDTYGHINKVTFSWEYYGVTGTSGNGGGDGEVQTCPSIMMILTLLCGFVACKR